jgi:hypothetical protein
LRACAWRPVELGGTREKISQGSAGRRLVPPHPQRLGVDGSKYQLFSPDTKGIVIFEGVGHYGLQITRSAPLSAATSVTVDGNQGDFDGTIAHFGLTRSNDRSARSRFASKAVLFPSGTGRNSSDPSPFSVIDLPGSTRIRRSIPTPPLHAPIPSGNTLMIGGPALAQTCNPTRKGRQCPLRGLYFFGAELVKAGDAWLGWESGRLQQECPV